MLHQRVEDVAVHWHDFYELGYLVGGTATHVLNGTPVTIRAGDAFLLTPADFHEIRATSGPIELFDVVIETPVIDQLPELTALRASPSAWQVPGFTEAETDIRRLWRESCDHRPGRTALLHALLRCILVSMWRRCGAEPVDAGIEQDGVRRAVSFVDHHFREPLTLAAVAAVAHLSANYLSERFGAVTGTSFQSYLQQRRLRFARSLLASTSLPVTEVCHAAGFNDLSHFGRAYRRHYGHPPSSCREGSSRSGQIDVTLRSAYSATAGGQPVT